MNEPRKSKAALYARVSTEYQADKSSIPAQKRLLLAHAKKVLGIKDTELFVDAGFTGTNTKRPSYQEMMARCRAGEFTHVLVVKIDRISRNVIDFAEMYEEFEKYGISLISLQESFDSSTPIGKMMLRLILIFAEMEVAMTSQRVTDVMKSRARTRKWNGGPVSIGYYVMDGEFYIDPDEAPTVQAIFDLFVNQNFTAGAVAQYLNARNMLTKHKKQWKPRFIYAVLNNPLYIGRYVWNRTSRNGKKENDSAEWIEQENFVPQLIRKDIWDAAQSKIALLRKEREKRKGRVARKYTHVFHHLIYCAHCGEEMAPQTMWYPIKALGDPLDEYRCTSRCQRVCGERRIGDFVITYLKNLFRADRAAETLADSSELEKILIADLPVSGIANKEEIFAALKKFKRIDYVPLSNVHLQGTERDEKNFTAEIAKLNRALQRLKDLYLFDKSDLSPEEYQKEKKVLLRQREIYETQLAQLVTEDEYRYKENNFKLNMFLLQKTLSGINRKNEYVNALLESGKETLAEFFRATISSITVDDRRIKEIVFANSLKTTFVYIKNTDLHSKGDTK